MNMKLWARTIALGTFVLMPMVMPEAAEARSSRHNRGRSAFVQRDRGHHRASFRKKHRKHRRHNNATIVLHVTPRHRNR